MPYPLIGSKEYEEMNLQPAGGSEPVTPNPIFYPEKPMNTSPISYISTEGGAEKVEKAAVKYPATTPNAPIEEKQDKTVYHKDTGEEMQIPAETDVSRYGGYTETKVEPKVAKFINENGQIISFTEDDLKNQDNVQKLKNEGYVFSEGDFVPTMDLTTTKQTALDEANKKLEGLVNEFNSYNVDEDPQFQSQTRAITQQFDVLRQQMAKTNESRAKAFSSLGMRGGTTEFAGGIQMGLEGEELNQANQRIAELTRQEQATISAARSAYETGKWNMYSKKISALDMIKEDKAKALDDYNTKLTAVIKDLKVTERQSTRDRSIAGFMQQGVTDPIQLLDFLNFDEQGKKIGNFTASEIAKTMKDLETAGNERLSVSESEALGLPYGTSKAQAELMGIIPKGKTADQYDIRTSGNDIVRINKETGASEVIFKGTKGEDPFTTQQNYQNTFGYSKEVMDNSKDFIQVRNAFTRIQASAVDPSAAGDLALIFNYMKVLDPGSVVRESEFATAANAASVPERIRAQYNRVLKGTRLSVVQRKDFVDRGNKLYNGQLENQVLFQSQARNVAASLKLDPDKAVPDSTNIKYKLVAQMQPGEVVVWNLETKEAGFILEEEFDPTLYIKF